MIHMFGLVEKGQSLKIHQLESIKVKSSWRCGGEEVCIVRVNSGAFVELGSWEGRRRLNFWTTPATRDRSGAVDSCFAPYIISERNECLGGTIQSNQGGLQLL